MASATLNSYPSERKKRSRYCVFCGPDTRQHLLPLLSFEPDGVGSAVAIRLALRLTRNEKACQSICAAIAGQTHEIIGQDQQPERRAGSCHPSLLFYAGHAYWPCQRFRYFCLLNQHIMWLVGKICFGCKKMLDATPVLA